MKLDTRVRLAVAALALGAVGLTACGKEVEPTAQPHVGGERFIRVEFKDLPQPEEATVILKAFGERSLLQSMTIETPGTVDSVMGFYQGALEVDGWELTQAPLPLIGGGTLATWSRLGRDLSIEVEPEEPTADDPEPPVTVKIDFTKLRRPGSKLPEEPAISTIGAAS